jgi:hypothetical protein
MAVTVLKKIYVDEAKHVVHDISARLSQVPTSANLAQSREAVDSLSSMFPLSRTLSRSRMLPVRALA